MTLLYVMLLHYVCGLIKLARMDLARCYIVWSSADNVSVLITTHALAHVLSHRHAADMHMHVHALMCAHCVYFTDNNQRILIPLM